jgi:hypothetical protein
VFNQENELHGSKTFYNLLREAAETHSAKSHDYASNESPYGNYHFAGWVAQLFKHSSHDMGFVGRIAEKIYRLANLESSNKPVKNESIEDTERDIFVITGLWMADRRDRRGNLSPVQAAQEYNPTLAAFEIGFKSEKALQTIVGMLPSLTPEARLALIRYAQNSTTNSGVGIAPEQSR